MSGDEPGDIMRDVRQVGFRWIALFLGMCVCGQASAQTTIPQEYDKTIKSAEVVGTLGADLFGDQTNFYTGATSFSATDVSLPGNNALAVRVGRRFVAQGRGDLSERNALLTRDGGFADWELDIPHLYGVFKLNKGWQVDGFDPANNNQRCSLNGAHLGEAPVQEGQPAGFWAGAEYWHGNTLYVPGVGDQEMLVVQSTTNPHKPNDGKVYTWVTNNQWYFSCVTSTANGMPGDAFLAVSPDGVRYRFDWFAKRHAPIIVKSFLGPIDAAQSAMASAEGDVAPNASPDPEATALSREEVWILPTRVEDRFGNYVTYTYDPAHPMRLLSIVANDGRQLTLSYNASGHVSSVSDGTRTWTYVYGNGLTEVVLPDLSKWQINFASLRGALTTPGQTQGFLCSKQVSSTSQNTYTGTLTHPSGAVGEFSFKSQPHGRSYVPKVCMQPGGPTGDSDYAKTPFLFDVVGITRKKLTGPGIATYQWDYVYGPPNNSWVENCPNDSCVSTKTVQVTGPGEFVRYTYGNRYKVNEGKLLKLETGASSASLLRTETTTYQLDPTGQLYPALIGYSPFSRGDQMATKYDPVKTTTITQDGTAYTRIVNKYDIFARPVEITRSSAPAP